MGSRGKRRIAVATLAVATAGLLAHEAYAGGNTDIAITDDQFSPANGEDLSFTWQWDPGGDGVTEHKHNVRQDAGFFDSGAPVKSGSDFQVLLVGAGEYHYYCEVHGSKSGGMDGVVRKYIYGGTINPGESQLVNWSGSGNFRYDVQYRVNGRKWKVWRSRVDSLNGSFGAGADPVDLVPTKEYEVRARTLRPNNFAKRTGWSKPFVVDVF